jgi:hypothetical protein
MSQISNIHPSLAMHSLVHEPRPLILAHLRKCKKRDNSRFPPYVKGLISGPFWVQNTRKAQILRLEQKSANIPQRWLQKLRFCVFALLEKNKKHHRRFLISGGVREAAVRPRTIPRLSIPSNYPLLPTKGSERCNQRAKSREQKAES